MPVIKNPKPASFVFEDDGLVPNNVLPFVIYKGAIDVGRSSPEKTIEDLFGANGWGQDIWRNGVYDFLHYHATVHEVLGIARGHARVRSVAIAARNSSLIPAMSPSCPPAPATSACARATTFR